MKMKKPKILIVPHYSGTLKTSEVFKRVIKEQIEKKLNKNETKPNSTES